MTNKYPSISIPQASGHLRYSPDLAVEIGETVHLFVLQVAYLCNEARIDNRKNNFQKGHWWTYQSHRDWQKKFFKAWSFNKVRRVVDEAIENGYIIKDNFNKLSWDETGWFRPNWDRLAKLKSIQVIDYDPQTAIEIEEELPQGSETPMPKMGMGSELNPCPKWAPPMPKMGTPHAQNDTTIPKTPIDFRIDHEEEGVDTLDNLGKVQDLSYFEIDEDGQEAPARFDKGDPFVRSILDNLHGAPKNLQGKEKARFEEHVLRPARRDPVWGNWCRWQALNNARGKTLTIYLSFLLSEEKGRTFEDWKAGRFLAVDDWLKSSQGKAAASRQVQNKSNEPYQNYEDWDSAFGAI